MQYQATPSSVQYQMASHKWSDYVPEPIRDVPAAWAFGLSIIGILTLAYAKIKSFFMWFVHFARMPSIAVEVQKKMQSLSQQNDVLRQHIFLSYNWEPKCIWISDSAGECIFVNKYMQDVTRRPATDFLGSNWINVIPQGERDSVIEAWAEAVQRKIDFRLKYHWLDREGNLIEVETKSDRILRMDNTVAEYVVTVATAKWPQPSEELLAKWEREREN